MRGNVSLSTYMQKKGSKKEKRSSQHIVLKETNKQMNNCEERFMNSSERNPNNKEAGRITEKAFFLEQIGRYIHKPTF